MRVAPAVSLLLCLAVSAWPAAPALAQSRLQIRAAVTPDAAGDTAGMRRESVATAPDREVWVGPVVMDLAPSSIRTVGLELDRDGTAALSVWLSDRAGAEFEALTAASVGRALAVVWDGQVLAAAVVESAIPNGMVMVTGLEAAEAERLADALRRATEDPQARAGGAPEPEDWGPASGPTGQPSRTPVPGSGVPSRPPLRLDPPPGLGSSAYEPAAPAPATSAPTGPAPASPAPTSAASGAAQGFVGAVARRDWRTVARSLHPDALRSVRLNAPGLLRLDGGAVRVEDGTGEVSFAAADALGGAPRSSRLADLGDEDVAVLYLAALDALGVWGAPVAFREVVGEVPDGGRLHVVMRSPTVPAGVSELTVVTLARDASGTWRPLLTQPQGF